MILMSTEHEMPTGLPHNKVISEDELFVALVLLYKYLPNVVA